MNTTSRILKVSGRVIFLFRSFRINFDPFKHFETIAPSAFQTCEFKEKGSFIPNSAVELNTPPGPDNSGFRPGFLQLYAPQNAPSGIAFSPTLASITFSFESVALYCVATATERLALDQKSKKKIA